MPLIATAQNYTAEKTTVEEIEVVRLADRAHKTEVSVVPSIGNIAYEMKVNGKNVFWVPPGSLKDFQRRPSLSGNPLLAPWANRLDQDAFFANGRKYRLNPDLGNVRRDQNQHPIHGLVTFSPAWKIVRVHADERGAEVTSRLEFWRYPELMAQFPFAHTMEMTYRLRDAVLEVETRIENLSSDPMPVAIGFHPYFRLYDSPRDTWKVHLAARDHVVLSPQLIPTGERKPMAFSDPQPLQGSQLDDVFTNLVRGTDGNAEFWVQGAKERVAVVYGPKYPVAVVYAPPGRNFICFEPMAGVTNAFNLAQQGLYKELQTVPPGGVWAASYWIKPSGF